jgi:hypothetical protein
MADSGAAVVRWTERLADLGKPAPGDRLLTVTAL